MIMTSPEELQGQMNVTSFTQRRLRDNLSLLYNGHTVGLLLYRPIDD